MNYFLKNRLFQTYPTVYMEFGYHFIQHVGGIQMLRADGKFHFFLDNPENIPKCWFLGELKRMNFTMNAFLLSDFVLGKTAAGEVVELKCRFRYAKAGVFGPSSEEMMSKLDLAALKMSYAVETGHEPITAILEELQQGVCL